MINKPPTLATPDDQLAQLLSDFTETQAHGLVADAVSRRVGELLDAGADPNRVTEGFAPLHHAAQKPDLTLLNLFIAALPAHAAIDVKDRIGRTPLHHAVAFQHAAIVNELLSRRADPNACDSSGLAPLPMALMRRANSTNDSIIDALLKHGACPSLRDAVGMTAYHYVDHLPLLRRLMAADGGSSRLARPPVDPRDLTRDEVPSFLRTPHLSFHQPSPSGRRRGRARRPRPAGLQRGDVHGAEPDANPALDRAVPFDVAVSRDMYGYTPLHYLARNYRPRDDSYLDRTVEPAPAADAFSTVRPDTTSTEPPRDPAKDYEESIRLFVKGGADVNACGDDRATPLHMALRDGVPVRYVAALLGAGADPNATDRFGKTPLHMLSWYAERPSADVVALIQTLVRAGGDPDALDDDGMTPLYRWISENDAYPEDGPHVIAAFARAGADPHATPDPSLLHRDDPEQPEADFPPATPADHLPLLHLFASNEAPDCIDTLIVAGADPNLRDSDGKAPLHHVLDDSCVRSLVAGDAAVDAPDGDGLTPLYVAVERKDAPVVRALIAAGARTDLPREYPVMEFFYQEVNRSDPGDTELMKALVSDLDGALIEAIEALDRLGWIRTLIQAGARSNARREQDGTTPLHAAAESTGNHERADGDSFPTSVIELLKHASADPNARDLAGATPLHRAASRSEQPDCIAALLRAGSDPSLRDGDGRTPWELLQDNRRLRRTLRNTSSWRELRDAHSRAVDSRSPRAP